MIFMETSADGWGDNKVEDALKASHVSYLYNSNNLKKYPNIKGLIWFNVVKGEQKNTKDLNLVMKNFTLPDGMWNNHGKSTVIPGAIISKSQSTKMMNGLYPNAISDPYFLGPGGSLYAPTAEFSFTPEIVNTSEDILFDETVSGYGLGKLWNFGDGSIYENATNPVYQHRLPGRYNVTLTVSNSYGNAQASHIVSVRGLIPDFNITPSGGWAVVDTPVTFRDNSKGNPVEWVWDFGDGSIERTTQNITIHNYTKAGIYTINLKATNWQPITVSAPPKQYTIVDKTVPREVDFDLPGFKQSGKAPFTVEFKDITPVQSDVTGWLWDFGDGSNSVKETPSHTYTIPGQYTVILTVRNDMGTNEARKVALIVVT